MNIDFISTRRVPLAIFPAQFERPNHVDAGIPVKSESLHRTRYFSVGSAQLGVYPRLVNLYATSSMAIMVARLYGLEAARWQIARDLSLQDDKASVDFGA